MSPLQTESKLGEVRVSKLAANIVGSVLAVLLCAGGVALAQVLPHRVPFSEWQAVAALAGIIIVLPAHEALHALGLRWFAGVQWRHIRFGVMWQAMMPYCHCTVPISIRAFRQMALLPLWVTGGLSLALVLAVPADFFGAFAGLVVAACVGDVWMVLKLRPFSESTFVLDSPSEIGCDVFSSTKTSTEHITLPNDRPATPPRDSGVTGAPPPVS